MGHVRDVLWDTVLRNSMNDFPFRVAANPSSIWPVKKEHHYHLLRICWKLDLVSLIAVRNCADALQERTT